MQTTEHSKRASATKRGPGRYHSDGHQKATPPKPKGASSDFVLHTNSDKRKRRADIKAMGGIRQHKRAAMAMRLGGAVA